MPIVPSDLSEPPKQPDNSQHNLNYGASFAYHQPDEEKNYFPREETSGTSSLLLSTFYSELFTSGQNYQYILPNGRIGMVQPIVNPINIDYNTQEENNKIIYDAKKAKGEEVVYDVLGREYTPNTEYNLTDSQDYIDESPRGQISDFYQYNSLDPKTNTAENRAAVNELYQDIAGNNNSGIPANNSFISDRLGSNTALVTPNNINNTQTTTNTQTANGNLDFIDKPQTNTTNVLTNNYPPFTSIKTTDNPLSAPFFASDYNDFTGTPTGEFYHILQFMQESFKEITKVKVPYIGLDGNPVSQELASKELTGNVPVFDPYSESYGWTATSPYYQNYINKHVIEEHGGTHDVITPRGYRPEDLLLGGITTELPTNNSNNEIYKTPLLP